MRGPRETGPTPPPRARPPTTLSRTLGRVKQQESSLLAFFHSPSLSLSLQSSQEKATRLSVSPTHCRRPQCLSPRPPLPALRKPLDIPYRCWCNGAHRGFLPRVEVSCAFSQGARQADRLTTEGIKRLRIAGHHDHHGRRGARHRRTHNRLDGSVAAFEAGCQGRQGCGRQRVGR